MNTVSKQAKLYRSSQTTLHKMVNDAHSVRNDAAGSTMQHWLELLGVSSTSRKFRARKSIEAQIITYTGHLVGYLCTMLSH